MRTLNGELPKNGPGDICSHIQLIAVQIYLYPLIIPAILQLSKPDFHSVSHKIKLERKSSLKGQDPDASKGAAISGSAHDSCL